jgi:hypothetical protein
MVRRTRASDLCQAVKAMHEAEAESMATHPQGAVRRRRRFGVDTAAFLLRLQTNIEMVERVLLNYKWVMLDACRVKADRRSIRDFAQCATSRPPKPTSDDIR